MTSIKRRPAIWRLLTSGATIAACPAAAFAQAAQAPASEIVVTAQKRSTALSDTPEAVSVVTGASLEVRGAQGIEALQAQVPNLSFSQNFGITQIFIRGVGNSFFSPGGDPGVAFYADGVYVSDQETNNTALFDLARVEVLRGPQGTLYGRNATGGAVNLVFEQPEDVLAGRVSLVAGDYGRLQSDGFLTGPIAGGISGRFSYQLRKLDGFTRNLVAGGASPDRLDDMDSQALRLQLAAPLGGGSLQFIGGYFHQDDNGPALKVLRDPFPHPAELLFGATPAETRRSIESNYAINEREAWNVTAKLKQPIGTASLALIADYRKSDRRIGFDQDGTEADVSRTTLDTRSDQLSFDAYLASADDARFSWLVGGTYIDFDQSRVTSVDGVVPLGFISPGDPLNIPVPFAFRGGGKVASESLAGYAEAGFAITPELKLSGGVRYSHDKKSADEFLDFFQRVTAAPKDGWGKWTARVRAEWRPASGGLIYAQYSQGYKSGAINLGALTPTVAPETIDSYELGAKFDLAARAQISLAAFKSDYSDMQILQIGPLSQILSNAGTADLKGVELEIRAEPVDGLRFDGSLSLLDAQFGGFVTTDPRRGFASFDVGGNRLPLTSKIQATAGVEYVAELANQRALSVRADYSYRSRYYFTEFNTPDAVQKGFGRWDASASLTLDDRWKLFAFVRNIGNSKAIGSMAIVSPLLGSVRMVNLEPPRHFGAGIDFRF